MSDTISTTFKVGDWVFCEFKLQQIKEICDGHITSISDGWFSHSSSDLDDRCFPIKMRIKTISNAFESWSAKLHREGMPHLNYPDIHNWLVEKWCKACQNYDTPEIVKLNLTELDTWGKKILQRCNELKHEKIDDM